MVPFNRKAPKKIAQKVRSIEADIKTGNTKVPWLPEKKVK